MDSAASIDVQAFVDKQPLRRFQIMVACLCFLTVAIDGIDLGIAAYIAPSLRHEWGLTVSQLSPVFVSGLVGMMIGSLVFGLLADRFGRRPVLLAAVALFGLATLLTVFVSNVPELVVLRFLTGVGIGGATPTAVTLTAEYAPARSRLSMITIMLCGNSLGYALGGVVAADVIGRFGWQGMLVVGGVAPVLLLPALWLALPESMRYLALRRHDDQGPLRRLARRLSAEALPDTATFHSREIVQQHSPVRELLVKPYLRGTLMLWTTSYMGLSILFLLASWLPVMITNSGGSMKSAALIGALFSIGGTTGGLLLGRFMDWGKPHRVLGCAFAVACVSIVAIGQIYESVALVAPIVFVAGFCVSGSMVGVNGLAATYYPTASRATGVSWASGIGRIGSMFGSAIGGYMLASELGYPMLFTLVGVPALIAAACMFGMPHRGKAELKEPPLNYAPDKLNS